MLTSTIQFSNNPPHQPTTTPTGSREPAGPKHQTNRLVVPHPNSALPFLTFHPQLTPRTTPNPQQAQKKQHETPTTLRTHVRTLERR